MTVARSVARAVASPVARAVDGGTGGLPLFENRFPWSEDFSQTAWAKDSVTVQVEAGTPTLYRVVPNNAVAITSAVRIYDDVTVTDGDQITLMAEVKAAGLNRFYSLISATTTVTRNRFVGISLTDGSIYTENSGAGGWVGVGSPEVTALPDGWYRLKYSVEINGDTVIRPRFVAVDSVISTGDGTSGIYLRRVQIAETNSSQKAYIKTEGSIVVP